MVGGGGGAGGAGGGGGGCVYMLRGGNLSVKTMSISSATATISYPASLSNLPNGCQGHPRFYPPPDRSPITKPDSNYVLTRCSFYSTIGMG
jgi:hypothetical protein